MTNAKTHETLMGTCGACFRAIAVEPQTKRLVLHGYQRPGDGAIRGRCFGVGYLPYELSADCTRDFLAMYAMPRFEHLSAAQVHFAGDVQHFTYIAPEYVRGVRRDVMYSCAMGVSLQYTFDQQLAARRNYLASAVRQARAEVDSLQARIRLWTLEDLSTETRAMRADREAAAAKADVRTAAREAKAAKAAALKAKRAEKRAKAHAVLTTLLEGLQVAVTPEDVCLHLRTAKKALKGNGVKLDMHDVLKRGPVEVGEKLVKLGLARRNDYGFWADFPINMVELDQIATGGMYLDEND